jgi:tRNA threonylcarbamoyladenosine biosynthesis protein TsaB
VLAVIDARRGEAFAAAYDAPERGRAPVELLEARALAPEALAELPAAVDALGGRGGRQWLAVGDGALRFRDRLEPLAVRVPEESSPLHRVSAAAICELGAVAERAESLERLLPDYRRRPDAELALEAAAAGGPRG